MDNDEARNLAVDALAAIPSGEPLGTKLFRAIARLSISIPIEAVALRWRSGGLQVHMTQRPLTAPTYAGEWHCIGSFQRVGETEADTLQRLATAELGTSIAKAELIGRFDNPEEEVGYSKHLIFLVEFANEPKVGIWAPVSQLPDNTVRHHREIIIPAAAAAYIGDKSAVERLLPTTII